MVSSIKLTLYLVNVSEVHSGSLLFTTDYGDDANDCRSLGSSCRTLTHTLADAKKEDIVYLHSRQHDAAWLCHEDPIQIKVSVSFIGYDGMTSFGCPATGSRLLMLAANASGSDVISFKLQRVIASGIIFVVSGAELAISESILTGVTWMSKGVVGLEMRNSILEDRTGNMSFDMVARTINFLLENVTIARVKISITAGSGRFVVRNSTFTGIPDLASFHGGLLLTVTNGTEFKSYISIEDTIFEEQVNENPIDGIMNFHDSALKVVTEKPIFYNPNVSLLIADCTFRDNERGLTIMGPFASVVIHDSQFLDNIAMHGGAGALLWADRATATVRIERCLFERNAAGAFREESIRDHADSFKIGLNEVTIHTECCKGVISPVGKGGAIRVHRGDVILVGSKFRENTARQLGGAIYVDINGSLTIDGAYFENSRSTQRPLEGDIIYSNGVIAIRNSKMNVTGASSHVSILCHSGTVWSIEVVSIEITCPMGYRLRITNSSAYRVVTEGLQKSYKLDQLSYFCESCPRNKYSLDFGYLNYSLRYKDNAYFTLLVNGKYPTPAYSGSYDYHDIECQQCPYGGKCLQEISAVSNFWGYATAGHRVRFQRCQKGYCCSSANCTGFNTCTKNRIGVLCGECEPGYSEAMFTADCVLNSTCDPTIGWPVMLSSAVLYFIFLLFQKDIRDLMFSQIVRTARPRLDSRCCPGEQVICGEMKNIESSPAQQSELELLRSEEETAQNDLKLVTSALLRNADEGRREDDVFERPAELEGSLKAASTAAHPTATASDMGVSFLIIIFFYFQDAQLLHIKTVFTSAENRATAMFREFLSGLFKFRVEVFQFMHRFCFLENMTPVKKVMVRVGLVPCVLAQFGVVYLVYRWYMRVRFPPRPAPTRQTTAGGRRAAAAPGSSKFSVKMATGFVLALLFTYQKLATTSFTLLNCVYVNSDTVLFVQGTIACYQNWQYGVIAYAATCIVPFCLVLLIGPGLLKDDLIRLSEFFVACLLPLPFLVRWCWIRFRLYGRRATEPKRLTAECRAVIQIVQGPFKDADVVFFGPICGQGFLIGRRLILVLLYTFVNDTLIRMLCIMLLCFVILLHHVHVLPYKDKRGNAAGSVSAASLVIVAAINLVRAGFEAAEYVPQGPNELLMKILDEIENCLMLWFPGVVMGFVILTLIVKLGFLVAQDALEICRTLGKRSPAPLNNHAGLQTSIQPNHWLPPHSNSKPGDHSDRNDIHIKLADI